MKKLYAILALSITALIAIPLTAFADYGNDLYFYHFDLNPGYSAQGDKNVNAKEGTQKLNLYVNSSTSNNTGISYVSLNANKKMLFGVMKSFAEVKIEDPIPGDNKTKTYNLPAGEYQYVTKAYGEHIKGGINVHYNFWSN